MFLFWWRGKKYSKALIGLFFLMLCGFGQTAAPETFDLGRYTKSPPFISTNIPPNVILALDISGSMKEQAYQDEDAVITDQQPPVHNDFDPDIDYYGYFEKDNSYSYDDKEGYFIADPAGQWDGNFMNWLCMRRIDVVRKVMVGGKVSVKTEDQNPASLTHGEIVTINRNRVREWPDWQQRDWDRRYVLEGQNEPLDGNFQKSYDPNEKGRRTPSAFPDDTVFLVSEGKIIPQIPPGGKVTRFGPDVEIGQVTMDWNETGQEEKWVPFANDYTLPRVVAKGQTFNDDAPMTDPRIRWESNDTTGFWVRPMEWDYLDGDHSDETFSYIVVDAAKQNGNAAGCIDVTMDNGDLWQFCADYDKVSADSNNCGGDAQFVDIAWEHPVPSRRPIIFAGLNSWKEGAEAITVRNSFEGDGTSEVHAIIQEEEGSDCQDPAEEIVSIAVVPPAGTATATFTDKGVTYTLQVGLTKVSSAWTTIDYDTGTPFSSPPLFVADMQTSNDLDPAAIRVAGADRINDASSIELRIVEEKALDDETDHNDEDVGWLAVSPNEFRIRVASPNEPTGFVQEMSSSMRLGLAVYNYDHDKAPTDIYNGNVVNGGTLSPCYPDTTKPADLQSNYDVCLSTGVHSPLKNIIQVIEEHPLIFGTTPITETLWEIKNYLQQADSGGVGTFNDKSSARTYPVGETEDPYYYSEAGQKLWCAKTFVLHFNDGAPVRDWGGGRAGFPRFTGDGVGAKGMDESLDDLAFYLRHNDLRNDLDGHQEVISYYIYAALGEGELFDQNTRKIREAAVNGGFEDLDGDHTPDPKHPGNINDHITSNENDCSAKKNEWDRDGNCEPDTFYLANDGYQLVAKLKSAFSSITARTVSGTAASVISNSRSGEGALYQSLFYPKLRDSEGNEIEWAGQVHAILMDSYGNLREDSNANGKLDLAVDKFILFEGEVVKKYDDGAEDKPADGQFDDSERETPSQTGSVSDIKLLWSSSDWLNSSDLNPGRQRAYSSADMKRYIFTFIDDGDSLAESGEILAFTSGKSRKIQPYLHLFRPFTSPPSGVAPTDYGTFFSKQPRRIINYIRGLDQGPYSFGISYLPAMRSRQLNGRTWRLGDVVHSSPTLVAAPAENFDLIYKDSSYKKFFSLYRDRRNVVYAGANDGMFHAFNAGFYNAADKAFLTRPIKTDHSIDTGVTDHPLGSELWAYVPFSLLPHLYWLTDPNYTHVYYCDLKPKIFDAKIFADDSVHPGGWGTVLVGGMRFGGGTIAADLVKDGGAYDPAQDKAMSSAFFIMDITDPEAPPKLLAEISLPGMGFSTAYPTVATLRTKLSEDSYSIGDWYLVLGSGPSDSDGHPVGAALQDASSDQKSRIFVLDLIKLASGELCLINKGGICTSTPPEPFALFDENSFISDMISVDWDLDFRTDTIYFGTVSGDSSAGWGGKLRRLAIDDDANVSQWITDSTLIDTDRPVTAAPTAGLDASGNRWVFFGTGRFLNREDADNSDIQSFYGIKDQEGYVPILTLQDLLNVTDAEVYEENARVAGVSGVTRLPKLHEEIVAHKGWFLDLKTTKERNLGQAALLGDVLTFTSYVPELDSCQNEGASYLYALDFTTGTAFERPVIGTSADDVNPEEVLVRKNVDLGSGLASSPGIHAGRGKGSRAVVQGSSGGIQVIEQDNPGHVKSGTTCWQEEAH